MQSIYERIEHLIMNKGMTKKAFCEELKISTGNLGDWKRGKSTPSTTKLIEISTFFQVSLDWIMLGKLDEEIRELKAVYRMKNPDSNVNVGGLTTEEQAFIREYIEFTQYRKRKQAELYVGKAPEKDNRIT
ncbi:helix-turn-helix domain-containing protein [Paenibacillus gallinarum]|uniref:Helix-turn-helix transcriptional regulator n=1 Tax=Paenibacillus gallinarum TaxID=2762232 RepID=A0ABR8SSR9_9BACL|nr:helix-turn-helix transcriptional regulator [Paenibacillus gallinarum]MBD7966549.1 helix-turn-helix transcriptional regulator [Paenibacillus gallinarum]